MQKTARAAVFLDPGQPLEMRSFALREPRGQEMLVRVTFCTLCGSDLHTFTGRRQTPTPTILGHEIIGRIERFGPDAPRHDLLGQPLREGDRITWTLAASCGACFYCTRELPQKCERLFKYGYEQITDDHPLSGGLADYCLLAPGTGIIRLPETLPDAVACPANCATATVAAALRAGGGCQGQTVLIQGAGMLGLTACAMAKAGGAAALGPAHGEAHGGRRLALLHRMRRAFVERHGDRRLEVERARSRDREHAEPHPWSCPRPPHHAIRAPPHARHSRTGRAATP